MKSCGYKAHFEERERNCLFWTVTLRIRLKAYFFLIQGCVKNLANLLHINTSMSITITHQHGGNGGRSVRLWHDVMWWHGQVIREIWGCHHLLGTCMSHPFSASPD